MVVQYGENAVKNSNMKYKKCINFAAEVASNGKYLKRDHVSPLLKDMKWITFNIVLQLNEASLMYKNLLGSAEQMRKKYSFDLRNKVLQIITRNVLIYTQIVEEQL